MKLYLVLAHVSASYPNLTGRLPTCYSPIRRSFHKRPPEGFSLLPALDLHVLGTPPAFVLSQDQTLHKSSKHMTDEIGRASCRERGEKWEEEEDTGRKNDIKHRKPTKYVNQER